MSSSAPLNAPETRAVERLLQDEGAKRTHVVVHLGGTQAFGFPSSNGGLDVRAIHMAPVAAVLGLQPAAPVVELWRVVDGVEISYESTEIGPALLAVLQGDGKLVECVLGSSVFQSSFVHDGLVQVVQGALSRRVHKHYHALATRQLDSLAGLPTIRKALSVLRSALTGTHLLLTGDVVTDVTDLVTEYGFANVSEFVARERETDLVEFNLPGADRWFAELQRALGVLDDAAGRSVLPPEPEGERELEAWLIATRRAHILAQAKS